MTDDAPRGDPDMAARIRAALAHSGRSDRQIALEVGVSAQSTTKWKKLGYIDKQNIPAFCRACKVSIEWFLTGDGDITASDPLSEASPDELIRAVQERLTASQQADLLRDLALAFSREKDAAP